MGGGASPPTVVPDALHAVMLIALEETTDTFGRLGGGSIVSRNRVLTTAALVADAKDVRMWFYITDLTAANRRQARQEWIQPNNRFDSKTLLNDIAVITFKADVFPELNVIKLAKAATAADTEATLLGYGFDTADAVGAQREPLVSAHKVIAECPTTIGASASHLCATATTNVVCPGDQGSGLYTGTGVNRRLVCAYHLAWVLAPFIKYYVV